MLEPALSSRRRPRSVPARRLHVLLAVDTLETGGAERYVVDLAIALDRRGHEVTVACSTGGPLAAELDAAGVPVLALVGSRAKRCLSLAYAGGLRRAVRELSPDVVHANCYASAVAAALATREAGVPLVLTEHTEAPWRGPDAVRASRWTYARAARIVAVSSAIARLLVDGYGVPRERVVPIANAVPGVAAARRPSGLPAAPLLVGRVARLASEKGVDVFLRAAARLAARRPDVGFVVAGDGALRAELEALAAELGLTRRVRFLGFRYDARDVIAALDVMALSSLSEGAPLVICEAMQAGVPVVASAVGGVPDQMRHGREGLLVAPGDHVALAAALDELLADPERARRMGAAGRRRALGGAHQAMVEQLEGVYRSVAEVPATTSQSLWRTGVV